MMDKNDYYTFYFLDEKKFSDDRDTFSKEKKNKLISTIGQIKNYNAETKMGEIAYESKILDTNFQRVSHLIQLDLPGLFFFYGFLNFVNDKPQFVCECISQKAAENFDRLEFQKYVAYKRNVIEKCKKKNEDF